jgi:hypothetical protein
MTMTVEQKKTEQEFYDRALSVLRDHFAKGDVRVFTDVKRVSRSGMTRWISCYVITQDEQTPSSNIWDISHLVSRLYNNAPQHIDGGVKVHGCGMDMAFHLVYSLSHTLFPHSGAEAGYILQKRVL